MDSIVAEIAIVILLCFCNGFLAMAELAVVSSNKARLRDQASKGSRAALRALSLAENSSESLASVQVGITLIGIVAGVFGGATIAEDVASSLILFGLAESSASTLSYLLVIGGITFISLVFGELVPKQLALANPERVAMFASGVLVLISKVIRPAVWVLDRTSQLVLRLFPFVHRERPEVTEEDIQLAVTEGAKGGQISAEERNIVFRAFRLDDRPISAFMTPRRDVVWLDVSRPFDEVYERAIQAAHSFFPVGDRELDQLLGVVGLRELVNVKMSRGALTLQDVLRPALKIPAGKDCLRALDDFKRERRQIAVVVDEHGGVDGIVTTHDLLEALVGDLADYEGEEQSIVVREDGSLLVDAWVDTHELMLRLGIDEQPEDNDSDYHSVGGVVFAELGKLPRVGAKIEWRGLTLEIVDMDGNRIDRLLVSRVAQASISAS